MSERKVKRKFYKQEKARLQKRIFRIRVIVDEVLKEEYDRRLFNLRHDDELRLLTLYAWSDRYKVPIKWMLKILIPIWHKKFARFKVRSALGCRVATLVGKKSEEIIREKIYREFSHGENRASWRQQEQERILRLAAKGTQQKTKTRTFRSILETHSVKAYVREYKKELKWNRKSKLNSKQKKQLKLLKAKPFRNNPWQN